MNTSTVHYPVIVKTPNDALKYSEARQKMEQSKRVLKKKKTIEKIKRFVRKIMKRKSQEKIVVDEQYCFSMVDDDSNFYLTENSTEDAYSELPSSNYFSRIIPPSPSLVPNSEVVPYNPNLSKKRSKFNFVRKIKEKNAARKAKKRYRENLQNTTLPLSNTDMTSTTLIASPKMKEILYENQSNTNATSSPVLNSRHLAPSANSSVQDIPSVPFSPSLVNSPGFINYMKNGKSNLLKEDISVSTVKEYASSIYSDDSYHLPDDEDNIIDEPENDSDNPSSMIVDFNEKDDDKSKIEGEEKVFKNPRYNGHFEDSDDESKAKPKPLTMPLQRPSSAMKKIWDNPFGRISFIEYTIDKQKEKEKNQKNKNLNQYNIITKPPLKNKPPRNGPMIVSKRSVSSLSASLSKSRQEEVHNAAIRARENSSLQLSKLANQNANDTNNTNNTNNTNKNNENDNKKEPTNNKIVAPQNSSPSIEKIETKKEKDEGQTTNRDSVVYNDKRGSVLSVTNLIKYSDFYDDSNDSSFNSTNAGNHYTQAINHYNMYKNKKLGENEKGNETTVDEAIEGTENSDNNFNVLDELKNDDDISDKRKSTLTEVTIKQSEVMAENGETSEPAKDEIEYNRYLPSIPSANYLFNNPHLTRSNVINIQDNNFNVLKYADTLKANRRSIIEAELKAKKEEEEKEKQRVEAKKEKERLKEEARKEKERIKQAKKEAIAAKIANGEEVVEEEEEEEENEEVSDDEPDVPIKSEDHYREYYEKEAVKRPEEKSIDALLESKEKNKGKSISEIVTRVFSKGNSSTNVSPSTEDDAKAKNSSEEKSTTIVESPLNEAASLQSKTSEKSNDESKKEEINANNSTISTRLFSFLKAPTKLLYNEEKEEDKEKEKEKEKVKENEKENEKEKENGETKEEEKATGVKEEKEKEKNDDKSTHIESPIGSPINPYIHNIQGSTKLVRSASLSIAKRHNQQIKESKYRNKLNLERNNSTHTVGSAINTSFVYDNEDSHIIRSKSTIEEGGNRTVTFADDDDDGLENPLADRTIIIEKKNVLEPDKTPTLSCNLKITEEHNDKSILSESGVIFTEPETEFNLNDDNVVNKIHNLQNDIILEEDEEPGEEDILVKIQAEMNKKFQNDYDNQSHHEISDTFSIASCSTFSSAI